MRKTVLITGAHGFIGRYVARTYKMNNYYVIGLGHGNWSKEQWLEWGMDHWHECDVSLENLVALSESPDVIVHCAGGGSVVTSIDCPRDDFKRTVLTTQNVVEFVRTHSPQTRIVYPSSAAVYGQVEKMPIVENTPLNPVSPYGVHKKIAEDICLLYAKQFNVKISIVRLFSVYGQGLSKQLLWDACRKLDLGDINFFGTGMEVRDWVHVKDAAALLYIANAFSSESCPIVNGGSGTGITVKEVLDTLFAAFGSVDNPNFIGVENIGNPVQYQADIKKVKSWLWTPQISLKQGIAAYVSWYKML